MKQQSKHNSSTNQQKMETTYPHQQVLEDNGIELKVLPEAIRKKVYNWKAKYSRFEENPTAKGKENIMKESIAIADAIQNHIEQGIDSAKQPEMTPSANSQPDAPQIAGVVNPQSQNQIQEAVQVHLTKEGRIYHTDLKSLLGQRSLPDRLEVGSLVLHRAYAFYYPA